MFRPSRSPPLKATTLVADVTATKRGRPQYGQFSGSETFVRPHVASRSVRNWASLLIGFTVTLVLSINGLESIWMLADRRLSGPSKTKDDGRKLMFLETDDEVAILGYAGLGATALGTEPADWMSDVLRGRELPMEAALSVLAGAIEKQLPAHLARAQIAGAVGHHVIIPAIVSNEIRFYSIGLVLAPDRRSYVFRHSRHAADLSTKQAPRYAIAGSGGTVLTRMQSRQELLRGVLHLVNAYDRGRVSGRVVADQLARLNHEVYLETRDDSVGPRCIVAWRNKKKGVHQGVKRTGAIQE